MPKAWNERGEKVKLALPAQVWRGYSSVGTGIELTGLYYGTISKKKVARTYSYWQKRDGNGCVGEEFHLLTDDAEVIRYCDAAGIKHDYAIQL